MAGATGAPRRLWRSWVVEISGKTAGGVASGIGPRQAPDVLPVCYQVKAGALCLPFANSRHSHEVDAFRSQKLPDRMSLVCGVVETTHNYVEQRQSLIDVQRAAPGQRPFQYPSLSSMNGRRPRTASGAVPCWWPRSTSREIPS
jgi:hypothetical protein